MNTIFSSCLDQQEQYDQLTTIREQPIKFKIINAIHLYDFILKMFAQPRKVESYKFDRTNLFFLTSQKSHIPLIYFPTPFPKLSLIIVYCHGSGSNLNNVYDFALAMSNKYGVAFLSYDYTGDGESQKQFNNFEDDMKLVLAWVGKKGYTLNRTILCGFSLGSYSALCLSGEMPRLLISPICGIISFFETKAARYEGQKYDNVEKAMNLKSIALITHCKQQLVDISHGKLLFKALSKNSNQVTFYQIVNEAYQHRSAPSFLCSGEGEKLMVPFLTSINCAAKKPNPCQATLSLINQLQDIQFSYKNSKGQQTNICSTVKIE